MRDGTWREPCASTCRVAERRDITLITGASEGIGRELARVFARHGHALALVARNRERLESLAEELRTQYRVRVHVLACDLLDDAAPHELARALEERSFDVNVLVNNAGVMDVGRFADLEETAILAELQLNAMVPIRLCRIFLPAMLARGRGRILNVASTAAFQAMPQLSTYAATKACLLTFGEGVAEELAGTGVTLTTLAPGPVDTRLWDGARHAAPALSRLLPTGVASDPRVIAQEGFDACMEGTVVHVPGLASRLTATISDVVPRGLVRRLAGIVGRQIR